MKQQRNANEAWKLIERNKHLNLHKQTKQKDDKNYKPLSARKGKTNNWQKGTLGSYILAPKARSTHEVLKLNH